MKSIRAHIAITVLSSLSVTTAFGQVIYGMGSHMGQGRTAATLLSSWLGQSGFTSFRDEVYWGDIERTPGIYDPSQRAKATLSVINKAASEGMSPLVVLDYGNKFYDSGDQPYSDEARTGFAKYSQYIARNTHANVNLFEIWNEWNIGAGTRPPRRVGSPEDYVKLVAAASKAIHEAKPKAQVIAGSLADDLGNWPWLQEALKYGLLNYADGISIHLYNYLNPLQKGGEAEFMLRIGQLERILRAARPSNPPKIYVTEIGWPNHQGRGAVPLDIAADSAIRFLLASKESTLFSGVWFYELQDGGTDPNDKEHHFGILNRDESEKPISCSLSRIGKLLPQLNLVSTDISNGIKRQTYTDKSGSKITAIWSVTWNAEPPLVVKFESSKNMQLYNTACKTTPHSITSHQFLRTLTNTPILIQHTDELRITRQ